MQQLKHHQNLIEQELRKVDLDGEPPELFRPVRYLLSFGGKRIRPVLCLMGCELFGGDRVHALYPAIGLEIFHNFTLVHDDIMDEALLRRGKPSVHHKWNKNIAILSGDLMQFQAAQFISKVDREILPEVLDLYNDMAIKVCQGQQWDINFESKTEITIGEYLEMIRLKTATLLATSLKMGAIIARTGKYQANEIYDFGINLGMSFQLQDDLLDTFGDKEKLGKKIGGDILANKKTYLLLKAFENADPDQKSELMALMEQKDMDGDKKISRVKLLFEDLDVKSQTEKVRDHYFREAFTNLNEINVAPGKIRSLQDLGYFLVKREK